MRPPTYYTMGLKIISLVLIVLGILMMAYTGFNYVTTESLVDIGPVHIDHEKNHFVTWPPILGIVFLVVGIVGFVMDRRNRRAA